jgi:hypothetical protein
VVVEIVGVGNMMVLGYRARYGGQFGSVPVIQAGPYQLIRVDTDASVPLPLTVLIINAKDAGADFLIIDNHGKSDTKATWVDVREAA